MRIFRLPVAAYLTVAVACFSTSARATAVPVTSCGQMVEGEGVLTADLDCSATTGPAVFLGPGARLELSGFTLLGNEIGVQCAVGLCMIEGPGTIQRAALPASQEKGVLGLYKARISNVVFQNWPLAINVLGPTDVRGCTIQDSAIGVLGERTRVVDSSFSNNGTAVHGSEGSPSGAHFGIKYIFWGVRVVRGTFTGNLIDIASYRRPVVIDSTCTTSDILHVVPDPFMGGDEWNVCS